MKTPGGIVRDFLRLRGMMPKVKASVRRRSRTERPQFAEEAANAFHEGSRLSYGRGRCWGWHGWARRQGSGSLYWDGVALNFPLEDERGPHAHMANQDDHLVIDVRLTFRLGIEYQRRHKTLVDRLCLGCHRFGRL